MNVDARDSVRDSGRSVARPGTDYKLAEEKRRIQREADRKLEDERRKRKAIENEKNSEMEKMKRDMELMKQQMMAMASQVAHKKLVKRMSWNLIF